MTLFAAACVVLVAGVVAVGLLRDRGGVEPPASVPADQPSPSTPDEQPLDPDVQAQIDEALSGVAPGVATFGLPIGEPWQGTVWTSDGEVDVYLARAVGDERDGEGVCLRSGCYGAGWSDGAALPHLVGGSRDPIVVPPSQSGEPQGSEPTVRMYWLLPEGTMQVSIMWSNGLSTSADAAQPFGPGTPTITAAVVPTGVTGGILSSGAASVEFDIPRMRSADELMADIDS